MAIPKPLRLAIVRLGAIIRDTLHPKQYLELLRLVIK
jgi:hypothetical protein